MTKTSQKLKNIQNRERVRKFRAKMSQEDLDEKRRKDRERYKKKKEQGLIKSVKDCTERDKRKKRADWRQATAKYRERKMLIAEAENAINSNTPPASDDEREILNVASLLSHSRRMSGRRKVRRDRAKAYRQLHIAEGKIEALKRTVEKYRKRLYRLNTPKSSKTKMSPFTKIKELTKGCNIPKEVKKRLLFGQVLEEQVVDNIKSVNNKKDEQVIRKAVSGDMFRKYLLIGEARRFISYKMNRKFQGNSNFSQYERKKRHHTLTENLRKKVMIFLEKDESSEMRPGKKDYIRKNKIQKQKRILLHPMKRLYKKFLNETNQKISLKTFYRLKPFWIVRPKWSDRQTCGCIKHSNFQLMLNTLYSNKVIKSNNIETAISEHVCHIKSIKCMFSICAKCKNNALVSQLGQGFLNTAVALFQWENISEKRVIKGRERVIKRMTKSRKVTTLCNLVTLFNRELKLFKKHYFTMTHQMQQMQNCKQDIKCDELVIHMDFSENYVLKYSSEVQSMHFGASKKQLSLHTGIYYRRNQKEVANIEGAGFCSVSENLDHQAHAIWIHMKHILEKLSRNFSNTETIHFFSDGPTSQYRNRINMYLLLTKVPHLFQHLKYITWNFSASGHGKGPMDGIGGALKRNADYLVLHGIDIDSASCFVEQLKEMKVEVWEVPVSEIEKAKLELPSNIRPIPSIMDVHQITWAREKHRHILLRQVSCFECSFGEKCSHFSAYKSSVEFLSEISILPSGTSSGEFKQKDNSRHTSIDYNSRPEGIANKNFKKVNILSNTQLLQSVDKPLEHAQKLENKTTPSGICFICTFNFCEENLGIQCLRCKRAYHMKCAIRHKLPIQNQHLLCLKCNKNEELLN